jgi:hypothetical protein
MSNRSLANPIQSTTESTDLSITSTKFVGQSVTSVSSGRPFGGRCVVGGSIQPLAEETWSARDFMKKPQLVYEGTWTTDQAPGTQLMPRMDVPQVLNLTGNLARQMLECFAYFKLCLVTRFVFAGSTLHQGAAICFTDPFNQMSDEPYSTENPFQKYVNVFSASMQPGGQVDISKNNVVEINIPFEHILRYMTTNSKDSFDIMTSVRMIILNRLRVATGGTTTVGFKVYLYAKSVELGFPIHPHDTQIPTLKYILSKNRMRADAFEEALGGVMKGISGAVQLGTGIMSGNLPGVISGVSNLVGGVNEVAGNFDKPNAMGASVVNHNSTFAPIGHMKGVDSNTVNLGGQQGGLYATEPFFSGVSERELNIKDIIQKKGLVEQYLITTDYPTGHIIRRFPVMAGFCAWEAGAPGQRPVSYHNFLSYMSNYHTFYSGSFEFEFHFIMTMMQRATIGFAFVPNAVDRTHVPTSDELASDPYAVVALDGNTRRFNMTIPWVSSVARKYCVPWASVNEDYFTDETIVGYLYAFIINPLTTPQATPSTIEMNVYVGAGSDFEFTVPRARNEVLGVNVPFPVAMKADAGEVPTGTLVDLGVENADNAGAAPLTEVSAETGILDEVRQPQEQDLQGREAAPITKTVLAAGSVAHKLELPTGESYPTVLDLCRRACLLFTEPLIFRKVLNFGPIAATTADSGATYLPTTDRPYIASFDFPITPMIPSLHSYFDYGAAFWSLDGVPPIPISGALYKGASSTAVLVTAMSRLFAVWRGGLRFIVQPQTHNTQPLTWSATYVPDNNQFNSPFRFDSVGENSAYSTHIGNLVDNKGISVTVPYYSGYDQLVTTTNSVVEPNGLSMGNLIITASLPATLNQTPQFSGDNETLVFQHTGESTLEPAGTPYINCNVYMSAADDFTLGILVSPPFTYSLEDLSPPPANSVNSVGFRKQKAAWLAHIKKQAALSEKLFEEFTLV